MVGLLVNGELEKMQTEGAVTYSKVLSRYLREQNYTKSHSECTVSGRSYKPGPSGIKITKSQMRTARPSRLALQVLTSIVHQQ